MNCARYAAIFATVLAIAAVVAAVPTRAQEPGSPSLSISQVDATGFPQLRITVTALDERGIPDTKLTADQLQVFDGKERLAVESVQPSRDEALRLATVITIDTSHGMAGAAFDRARLAATEVVNSMGPNDEVALVAFNDRVTPVVALTNDRQKLAAGISSLQAGGGAALYEAVQTSAYIARSSGAPRSAVILLTGGENNSRSSSARAEGSISAANGAGVPIFAVDMGAPDAGYLKFLSTATHGRYRSASTSPLSDVYTEMAALLRTQYVVTAQAPGVADGAEAGLQIIATVAGSPAGAVASYKRGLPSGASAAHASTDANAAEPGSGNKVVLTIVFGAAMVLVGLVAAWLLSRLIARRRAIRPQLDVTERSMLARLLPVASARATGVLREMNGSGRLYDLGAEPAIIGTSSDIATIVFPASDQIAEEHVRIWWRNGQYTLHHVGGTSRKTYVAGQEADWLILESGDEVVVGPYRFIFEEGVSAVTAGTPGVLEPV